MSESVRLFVEYEGADDLVGDFTDNLSSGITFVATTRELPANTHVQLVLSFPGLVEPIAIDGIVQWTRLAGPDGEGGASIEFEAGAGRDALAAMIERVRNRDPKIMSRAFRILLVEDNRQVAALIQEGFNAATRRDPGGNAFVFRCAEDGRSAIEILRSETFDALIVDVYLPILDGPQVISQVRRELGLSELPIIAVSAGGVPARRSALAAGANIFLDKPMRLRQMIDSIRQLLPVTPVAERAMAPVSAT